MERYIQLPRIWLFPVIILFILFSSTPCIAKIAQKRTVLIGSNENFAPFEFINKKGGADGYTVNLMRAVAKRQGLNIKIVLDTWSNTYQALKDGQINAVTGMLYSKKRDINFDFSVPHLIIPYALFKRKDTLIRSLDDLKNKEIITVSDVYAHEWLNEKKITNSIIAVKTPTEALELLAAGKHDCVVLPRLQGVILLDDLKIDTVETFGPPVLEKRFCFAVASGNSELLAELNEGLFSIQQSGEYDEIYLKWISVSHNSNNYRKLLIFALLSLSAIIFALFAIGIWNWLLKRTVRIKTKELRRKEAKLKAIVEGIPIPTFVVDENHIVTHWNMACELLTGKTSAKMVGTKNHPRALFEKQPYSIVDLLLENVLTKSTQNHDSTIYRESPIVAGAYETDIIYKNSEINNRWLCGSAALLRDETGNVNGAIEIWQDLTTIKELESQLIQSQKMEALGTLAGGIAHDFNNILSVVIGNADLISRQLPKESLLNDKIERILSATKRAKNLVMQILTYSRQAEIKTKPVHTESVHVHSIVKETLELINISLPQGITICEDLQSNALAIADASHIHQIVMNLFTNALHSMKDKEGVLSVSLNAVQVDKDKTNHAIGLIQGKFVKLTVGDTGHGIPIDIQYKIFDPFFTTKKRGEGTGMGLSVTQGIVQQYNGIITFDSESGKGTTFHVYLPQYVGRQA